MGHSASRSCCLFFWSDGAWRHSPQQVGLCLSLLAWTWEAWGGAAPGYSQFPKQSLLLGRAWSYAQPWLWINLPACVQHRTPPGLGPRIALLRGPPALPDCLLACVLMGFPAPGSCQQSCGQLRLEGTVHSGWGCDSAFCFNVGKPGSWVNKTHLRIWIREIWTPLCPLVRLHPNLVLQVNKATGLDYCLGIAGMNLICHVLCVDCCKPIFFSFVTVIPSLWALQIPLKSPWGRPQ